MVDDIRNYQDGRLHERKSPIMKEEPRIYVVDDDEAVRDSLSVLLAAQGYRVNGFRSAPAFLAAAPALPPGCLIADIRMPEMDGLELQQRLNERSFSFPMIVITGHGDVPLAVRAMKAGAVDFIEKPFTAEAILAAIEAGLALLSSREREVLAGLVAGLPNKAIAYDLAISPRTVEIHRAHIMQKMQAKSLSELVRLALAAGVAPS